MFRELCKRSVVVLSMALAGCAVQPGGQHGAPSLLMPEASYQQRVAYVRSLFREQEKIARVAYALSTRVRALCQGKTTHTTGAYLFDWDQTDEAWLDAANDAVGINLHTPGIEVLIVIAGSPADKAGLRVGDRILRLGDWYVPKGRGAFAAFRTRLDRELRSGQGTISFRIIRDGAFRTVTIEPVEACDYPILISDNDQPNAYTDGDKIVVYRGMAEFARDDQELAIVISHELSHIVLGHIDAQRRRAAQGAVVGAVFDVLLAGVTGVHVRLAEPLMSGITPLAYSKGFEDEADYFGTYMMAMAGFDITRIADFQRSFGASQGSGAAYSASHPTFDARARSSEQTVSEIREKIAGGQPLEPELARLRARAAQGRMQ